MLISVPVCLVFVLLLPRRRWGVVRVGLEIERSLDDQPQRSCYKGTYFVRIIGTGSRQEPCRKLGGYGDLDVPLGRIDIFS